MLRFSKIKEFIKRHLVITSTVTVLLILSVGVAYPILNNPTPAEPAPQVTAPVEQPAPPVESKPPPAPAPPPPTFEQKIENFNEAIAEVFDTGERKEITLAFTEAEVNEQAAKLLAHIEMPADIPLEIEAVDIDFQADNKVITEARSIIYDRFKVTIKAKAQVSIEEGEPEVEVTSISFGFVPLPKSLRDRIVALGMQKVDAVQAQLTRAGAGGNGKVDLEFTNINIQESNISATLLVKPGA